MNAAHIKQIIKEQCDYFFSIRTGNLGEALFSGNAIINEDYLTHENSGEIKTEHTAKYCN